MNIEDKKQLFEDFCDSAGASLSGGVRPAFKI